MPGSDEKKAQDARHRTLLIREKAIHRIQEFEKQAGKKLFYSVNTNSLVGSGFEKEFIKDFDRWMSFAVAAETQPRLIIGAHDLYQESTHKHKESDLVKQVFKHAKPETEIYVVDAHSDSIVKVSKAVTSISVPSKIPTREDAIKRALATMEQAHPLHRGQMASSAAISTAEASLAHVMSDEHSAKIEKAEKGFEKFEKELDEVAGKD